MEGSASAQSFCSQFEIIDVSGSLEPSPLARVAASGSYRAMSNEILFRCPTQIPCCTATLLPGTNRNSPDLTLSCAIGQLPVFEAFSPRARIEDETAREGSMGKAAMQLKRSRCDRKRGFQKRFSCH
jgi:hypothetical protein